MIEPHLLRKILNVPASLPLYFTATALAKLAHQAQQGAMIDIKNIQNQSSLKTMRKPVFVTFVHLVHAV